MRKKEDKELKLFLAQIMKKDPRPYTGGGGVAIITADEKEIFAGIEKAAKITIGKQYELYCYQSKNGNWQLHRFSEIEE